MSKLQVGDRVKPRRRSDLGAWQQASHQALRGTVTRRLDHQHVLVRWDGHRGEHAALEGGHEGIELAPEDEQA